MQLKYASVLIKERKEGYMPFTWLRALISEERCISELPILEGRLALALLRNGPTAKEWANSLCYLSGAKTCPEEQI